jgi:hypothetical protein
MKSKNVLVPVKRIIKIINSCQNDDQIESCKTLIQNYVKSARKNNVINTEDLSERLNEELIQRQEQLYLVRIFNDKL